MGIAGPGTGQREEARGKETTVRKHSKRNQYVNKAGSVSPKITVYRETSAAARQSMKKPSPSDLCSYCSSHPSSPVSSHTGRHNNRTAIRVHAGSAQVQSNHWCDAAQP